MGLTLGQACQHTHARRMSAKRMLSYFIIAHDHSNSNSNNNNSSSSGESERESECESANSTFAPALIVRQGPVTKKG